MLAPENNTAYMRLAILIAVAKSYMQNNFADIDKLPNLILPDSTPAKYDLLGFDRLIVKIRCMAAMGYTAAFLPINTLLSELVNETLRRTAPQKSTVSVIREACNACRQKSRTASQQCQGNVHPCEDVCPVKALGREHDGREYINQDKCISCGLCLQACPFEAIVYSSQIIDVLKALKNPQKRTVAVLTPQIIKRFGHDLNQIIASFKELGFDEVTDTARFTAITAGNETSAAMVKTQDSQSFHTTEIIKKTHPEYHSVLIGSYLSECKEAKNNPDIDNVLLFEEAVALLAANNTQAPENLMITAEKYIKNHAYIEEG